MKRAVWASIVGAASVLAGCDGSSVVATDVGSGVLATESRPVAGFTKVSLSGAGHLIIQQTGVESLRITAEDNLLPFVRSEVQGDELVLGFTPGASVNPTHEVLYRLTVRDLTAIDISGASRVEIHGLDSPSFATVLSGASSLTLDGRADVQVLVVSGASRYEAESLGSRVVTATVSGTSYGLVRASETLTATVSGVSILEYFGNPILLTTVSGGSSVRQVGS
jgi:hypothetical protein